MSSTSQDVPAAGTDATTYAAMVEADPHAWTLVVQQTRRYLMRVLTTQGANWDEAEEFLQVTYVKAWERRAQFARGDTFALAALRGWLTSIAVNAWRDQLRHQTMRSTRLVNHCELGRHQARAFADAPADEPTIEQAAVRAEERAEALATITRLTGRLSPQLRTRVPLLLEAHSGTSDYTGQPRVSMQQVMAVTGLSRSAAKSAMHRLRLALRDQALLEQEEATG